MNTIVTHNTHLPYHSDAIATIHDLFLLHHLHKQQQQQQQQIHLFHITRLHHNLAEVPLNLRTLLTRSHLTHHLCLRIRIINRTRTQIHHPHPCQDSLFSHITPTPIINVRLYHLIVKRHTHCHHLR